MKKLQIAFAVIGIVLVLALYLQEAAINRECAKHGQLLAQKSMPAAELIAQPQSAEPNQADQDRQELLRLRAEFVELASQIEQAKTTAKDRAALAGAANRTLAAETSNLVIRPAEARDAGQATPAAMVQTMLWAAIHGDTNRILQLMTFEPGTDLAKVQKDMAELRTQVEQNGPDGILKNGPMEVRILGEQAADNNDHWLVTEDTHDSGSVGKPERVRIRWTDSGWRLVIGTNGQPTVESVDTTR